MDIMIWRSRILDKLKPQEDKKLCRAWVELMNFKLATRRPLNSTQALQCRRLLEYLRTSHPSSTDELTDEAAAKAVRVLSISPRRTEGMSDFSGPNHTALAHALIRVLGINMSTSGHLNKVEASRRSELLLMLSCVGEVQKGLKAINPSLVPKETVKAIFRNVRETGSEEDLKAVSLWSENSPELERQAQAMAISFYARHDRVEETKAWVAKRIGGKEGKEPMALIAFQALAPFAARNGLEQWAAEVYQELADQQPVTSYWHQIMIAQLWLGKGLKGAEAVMSNMVHNGESIPYDGRTCVDLMLRTARAMGDEKLANEITSLAADQGIAPGTLAFVHWMGLKVDVGNFDGAKFSFDRLRNSSLDYLAQPGTSIRLDHEKTLNGFLVLACEQKTPDFQYINEVLEYADEIQARLEPDTVAKLSVRFLENEQFLDVMDLLAVNAFKYSEAERQVVQTAFVSFCLDPKTSTGRAWSAYQVLEQYFPDLEKPDRVRLMNEFFRRKRPDMAMKVFGAMRNHRSPAYRPDSSMYRQCFEGLAKNPDLASTQQVYNWMKTDESMEPSTRIFTALMLAYTACGRSLTALDFWKEVTLCKEGPGYSTLAAVFWALEHRPDGAKMAREIWSRVESMDIDVPEDVYNAYIGAIAGSGSVVEAQKIIMNMGSFVGKEPSAMT
jgi:hypothetical protein